MGTTGNMMDFATIARDCQCCHGVMLDGLSDVGVNNVIRIHGYDPTTGTPGTPEQISQWRATLGTASGSYSAEQTRLDSAAFRAAKGVF
jgi:hypothetical protein